jgi:hypothetical protein
MGGVQPRALSALEAAANVVVGFGLALLTQVLVFPLIDLRVRPVETLWIALTFTAVSLARGFALRRLFERLGR